MGDPQEAGVRLGLLAGPGYRAASTVVVPPPVRGMTGPAPADCSRRTASSPGPPSRRLRWSSTTLAPRRAGPGRQLAGDRTAEGVGGAGRVAGQDGPGPAVDQQREQPELGGVELLGLVDQDRPDLGDGGGEDVGTVLEQVAGLEDEAGLVDRVLQGEVLAIEGEERRDRDPAGRPADLARSSSSSGSMTRRSQASTSSASSSVKARVSTSGASGPQSTADWSRVSSDRTSDHCSGPLSGRGSPR